MFCIMSFSLILCTILFQQDKRIKTYKLSELTKNRKKVSVSNVYDKQKIVEYTEGDNT